MGRGRLVGRNPGLDMQVEGLAVDAEPLVLDAQAVVLTRVQFASMAYHLPPTP